MDFQRILLYSALFVVGLMLWQQWEKDYAPVPATPSHQMAGQSQRQGSNENAAATTAASAAQTSNGPGGKSLISVSPSKLISVKTDSLFVLIDPKGGNIVKSELLNYKQTLNAETPYTLLNYNPETFYVTQSGVEKIGSSKATPVHYTSSKKSYVLAPDANSLTVTLTGKTEAGIKVEKRFIFKPKSYVIESGIQLTNLSRREWHGTTFNQIIRAKVTPKTKGLFHISSYMGASVSDPQNKTYEKITFDDMQEKNLFRRVTGGWIAMQQHYFLSAWVPDPQKTHEFYTKSLGNNRYLVGYQSQPITLKPKASMTQFSKLFVGPELPSHLSQVAPALKMTVDYGILWPISVFMFWLMKIIYQVVGNWGWAIVFLTLIIKGAFYYPSAVSYRSMAAMRKLAPKIEALKKTFGDDKQKMGQAMMDLYRKEKVNPLGGCLPILIQIPFFFALYWVLLESVQLRHAPFLWWIQDLSAPDPYFILPILMASTMWIQQKLSPQPPDPTQAKIMMALPILFGVMFLYFPAGLVLYWTVNNGVSILQQWFIMRKSSQAQNGGGQTSLSKA